MALHEPKDVIFLKQLNAQATRLEKDIRRHFTMIEKLHDLLQANRNVAKYYSNDKGTKDGSVINETKEET